jgi:hypothetical protein
MLPFCELLIVEDIPPNTERGGLVGAPIYILAVISHIWGMARIEDHTLLTYIYLYMYMYPVISHIWRMPHKVDHTLLTYIYLYMTFVSILFQYHDVL